MIMMMMMMSNTQLFRVNKKKTRLLKDVFITILDWKWRYTLLAFITSFMLSWLIFAVIWWIIAFAHGDYIPENLAAAATGDYTPCILANKNFASAFLFSVETQHTIGYGSRQTTEVMLASYWSILLILFSHWPGVS